MDSNERFNQIESLLVDLARKVDQQGEQIAQIITVLNRQGEAITRIGQRLDDVGEQIGDIINILKLSEVRHTETAQQQAEMMTEMQRLGKRTDATVEAIKLLLNRQQATDTRLDGVVQTQLQMLQRLDADKLDDLSRRVPAAEG